MNWSVITVPRNDLWSALEAIRLRGGTVTATKLAGSDVAITCVMGEGRSSRTSRTSQTSRSLRS